VRRDLPVCARAARAMQVAFAAAALLALTLAPPRASAALPPEGSALTAAGFTSGPLIAEAGLVWQGISGIVLTHGDGATVLLAAAGTSTGASERDQAWFGSRWWAYADAEAVRSGPIGGPLARLPVLARCNPYDSTSPVSPTAAGENLFVVLPRACMRNRHAAAYTLLRIDLRTRSSRAIAALPDGAESLAAAGRYVAVAVPGPGAGSPSARASRREGVRILNARTGALVRRVAAPAEGEPFEDLQIDAAGDVLAGCCGARPGHLARVAQPPIISRYWWAPAGARVGTTIPAGQDPVLSDGRISYLGSAAAGGEFGIQVMEARDRQVRTAVTFSGTASPGGIALSGNELAWEQQSSVEAEMLLATGGYGCSPIELSEPQLESIDLATPRRGPVAVVGPPAPAYHVCPQEA